MGGTEREKVSGDRAELVASLREAQARLACAEPGRRLDSCSCWWGFEAAIGIVLAAAGPTETSPASPL